MWKGELIVCLSLWIITRLPPMRIMLSTPCEAHWKIALYKVIEIVIWVAPYHFFCYKKFMNFLHQAHELSIILHQCSRLILRLLKKLWGLGWHNYNQNHQTSWQWHLLPHLDHLILKLRCESFHTNTTLVHRTWLAVDVHLLKLKIVQFVSFHLLVITHKHKSIQLWLQFIFINHVHTDIVNTPKLSLEIAQVEFKHKILF
jgi:hypothetical protein